ncbi:MAG TPA: tRNA (guanosine(46)-N7)-methyltransferase TrmB [Mycobacteriales bacterium]|nr:tRNA (guanosine(46)-N7)-methyltransferase TrmB [Mycobacteriales bacterium]
MEPVGAAPARPTEAYRIRSYRRRGTRLTEAQQRAWDAGAERYVLPPATQTVEGFRITDAFDRAAPLAVEIGFGVGESLLALAVARPDWNVVGFEVWQPGHAACLAALSGPQPANVRLSTLDAAWCLEHIVAPSSIEELWTFFPDPWPKPRHHKRRLVGPAFAALAASRLAPGGVWRLATDWPHYAVQMQEVLDAEPLLSGGVTERYDARPLTRFERRGIAAQRPIVDLAYRKG